MKQAQAKKYEAQIEYMATDADASGLTIREKRFRLHPVFFVSFTLLFIFLLGFVFHAMGYSVLRLFVSWDDETMKIRFDSQGNISWHEYENDLEPAIDDAFFQKLEELEMMPLMPSWLPEGYILESIDSKVVNEHNRWAAGNYACGDRNLLIFVFKNTSKRPGGILSL
jgi:hypothetical protein